MADESWLLPGATKDRQSITADWKPTDAALIEGVIVREAANVIKPAGYLTEIFRRDWFDGEAVVGQVFQNVLEPGAVSAWHAHARTTDRLFVLSGSAQIVLFDTRPGSRTHRMLNTFQIAHIRPSLVVIPPQVWHGVQNSGSTRMILLNLVDDAYRYVDPDHWRIPPDSELVPHRWQP